MLCKGKTKISRNLSKQPFSTGSGRITLKNSLRDYPHLLKSPNFRLLVLKCTGSYSRVFTVCIVEGQLPPPLHSFYDSGLNAYWQLKKLIDYPRKDSGVGVM